MAECFKFPRAGAAKSIWSSSNPPPDLPGIRSIRMLRRWNVDIFFEAEDIRSLHETSEFFLTVICAQAQDDSNLRAQILNGGCKNPSQTLILNITRENVMATHMMKTVIS